MRCMKQGLFPGTFDPPTLGHLDIIKRAACMCDTLYVAITEETSKRPAFLFSIDERKEMMEKICHGLPHVKIVTFSGLAVDFVKKCQANFLIRGLRAFSDFEYEFQMALANRKLGNVETVFFMADEKLAHISSTLIREIARSGTRLTDFIPTAIEPIIFKKLADLK